MELVKKQMNIQGVEPGVEHDLRRIEQIYSRLYIMTKIPACNTGTRNYVVNGKKVPFQHINLTSVVHHLICKKVNKHVAF